MRSIEVRVPDGKRGNWSVETFSVSEQDADFSKMRAMATGLDYAVDAGTYKMLRNGRDVVMSNTRMEVRSNMAFIKRATGNVLVNGLGLGMVLEAILKKPDVQSVTVIEKSHDVIMLVAPAYEYDLRVNIVHADAFDYQPPAGFVYDAVWHDIWPTICADNLPEMERLLNKYRFCCRWQHAWKMDDCLMMARIEGDFTPDDEEDLLLLTGERKLITG